MINIIHHEERENGELVEEYWDLEINFENNVLTKEELIELREKLNEMGIDKK